MEGMESPKYEPDYDDYPEYPGLGLTPSQLALIIGVNAVISLLIAVCVVLLVSWQVAPKIVVVTPTVSAETTVQITGNTSPNGSKTVIYRVQPNDTLSLIADKYSVPIYDLMLVNGLTNEDFIQVNQELIIPVGGLPTPTATFTPVPPTPTEAISFEPPTPLPEKTVEPVQPTLLPTSTPTMMATATAVPFSGVIVTISEVVSPGNLEGERIAIFNEGTGTSLKEWTLGGSSIGTFSFPDIYIFSGGTIRIHTKAGQSTPSDLYLNQQTSAWLIGTTITLRDNNGVVISTFAVR
jgi:LysM repeat protein